MRTVMHIGSVAIAAVFALALVSDAADARRGGGGGGGMRGPHISKPIARPGGGGNWANRPGGGGNWAGRPGYRPGWNNPGYRPGYGWGAAAAAGAIGAGIAYGAYGSGYYGSGYYDEPAYSYPSYTYEAAAAPEVEGESDAIAECARRFKTYDAASQTYVQSKGVRASCP